MPVIPGFLILASEAQRLSAGPRASLAVVGTLQTQGHRYFLLPV